MQLQACTACGVQTSLASFKRARILVRLLVRLQVSDKLYIITLSGIIV